MYKKINFPLSHVVFGVIMACIVIPAIFISSLTNYIQYQSDLAKTEQDLELETKQISRRIEFLINENMQEISKLAETINTNELINFAKIQEQLLRHEFIHLENVHITDKNGNIIASKLDSDLSHFEELKNNLGVTTVSSGISNNIFLNIPIKEEGSVVGFVAGALKLDYIFNLLKESSDPNTIYSLVDQTDKVILSTDHSLSPLENYALKELGGLNEFLTYQLNIGSDGPLKLIAKEPLKPLQDHMKEVYGCSFMIGVLFSGIGFLVAYLIAYLVKKRLNELSQATANLPDKLSKQLNISWPVSKIKELSDIIKNFRQTAQVLEENFFALKQINFELREEVEQKLRIEKSLLRQMELVKENEAKMRALINAIPDELLRVNSEGKILECHKNNYVTINPMEGKYIHEVEVLTADVAAQMISAIKETIRTGNLQTLEYTLQYNSQIVYEEARIIAFSSTEALIIIRNITEQRLLEYRMCELNQELEKANRIAAIGIMGSSIAHEINQPLQAIQMTASRMVFWRQRGKELDANAIVDEFATISEQVDRITDIIDGLRNLSQGIALPFEEIELNTILAEVIINCTKPSPFWISIKMDFDPNKPVIFGNKVQLEQAIQNLLKNAIEAVNARSSGPRQIVISSRLEHDRAVIEVKDSGYGVPAHIANHIFEPFYSTKDMGMGLGLAITERIISAHQGKIRLIKNDANGATFRIKLPVRTEGRRKHEDLTG